MYCYFLLRYIVFQIGDVFDAELLYTWLVYFEILFWNAIVLELSVPTVFSCPRLGIISSRNRLFLDTWILFEDLQV